MRLKPPDSITIPFLLWLLVLLPAVGVRAWWQIRSGKLLPPKQRRYQAMIALQVVLFAMTSLAAQHNAVHLFGPIKISTWIWLTAVAYLALITVKIKAAWPRLSEERKQRARLILPESPSEMRYWIPISILAGVSEEYAYRGVAYVALSEITGSPLISVGVCAAAFGIAHVVQGWRGVLGATLLALLFHLTVFLTQSLYLAIIFHAAYDLDVGVLAMSAFMRDAAAKVSALGAS